MKICLVHFYTEKKYLSFIFPAIFSAKEIKSPQTALQYKQKGMRGKKRQVGFPTTGLR